MTRVAERYHSHLGEEARQYLTETRNLSDFTVDRFLLGQVNAVEGHEQFTGMLSIPFRDAEGTVYAMKLRRLDGRDPRYLSLGSPRLFNVASSEAEVVYLTEGEFDTMVLEQLGKRAVGIPGRSHWRRQWRWLFRDASEVVVVTDRDDEGQGRELSRQVLEDVSTVATTREVNLPHGHDVNSLYLKNREELEVALR